MMFSQPERLSAQPPIDSRTDDVASESCAAFDLFQSSPDIGQRDVGHGLDRDREIGTDPQRSGFNASSRPS